MDHLSAQGENEHQRRLASLPYLQKACLTCNHQDTDAIKALLDQLKTSNAWQNTVQSAASLPLAGASGERPADDFRPGDLGGATTDGPTHGQPPQTAAATAAASGLSVASLLSKLQASTSAFSPPGPSTTFRPPTNSSAPSQEPPAWANSPGPSASPPRGQFSPATEDVFINASSPAHQVEDLRGLTFQQALPYLAQLAQDPSFAKALAKVRQLPASQNLATQLTLSLQLRLQQAALERQLFHERSNIEQKHKEKVHAAQTK